MRRALKVVVKENRQFRFNDDQLNIKFRKMKDNKKILDERFTKGKGGSETITSTTFSNYNLALLNIVV